MGRRWIKKVVEHMKKGSFTRQALSHHMLPGKFASEVVKHPKKYTLKTRRRAQFLKNIQKSTRKNSHKE
jgi:hypothetical protein